MAEPLSSRKRSLEHASEEEEPKKKVVAVDCIILLADAHTHFTLHQIKTQSKKKRPGFDEEIFSETSYFIDNGKHLFCKYVCTYCCKVFWSKVVGTGLPPSLEMRCWKVVYVTYASA